MPRMISTTFGGGDMSWIGSGTPHIAECRTEILDISTFTPATHFPNGFIPSGTAVAKVSGVLVPYDPTEATVTDAGILAGHILTDQAVGAVNTGPDFAVPLYDQGRVITAKVPGTFTAPVAAAKRAATSIVYV